MPRKRWIKLWTQETLYGTTIKELEPAERWVWLGFLALAGDSIEPGKVQAAPSIPWTDAQLAQLLGVSTRVLQSAKTKMVKHGKITINSEVVVITNWEKYQSEYERTRKYKHTPFPTPKSTPEQKVENNGEKIHQKVSAIPDQTIPEDILPFTKVKGFQDALVELDKIGNKGGKIAFLINAFKYYHENAPPADFESLGSRIAGILKLISDDYRYLAKLIWDSSSVDIAGSHLNYIQGMIRKDGKGKRSAQQLPQDYTEPKEFCNL